MRWLILTWLALWAVFSLPVTSVTSVPQWDHILAPRVRAASRIRPDHVLNVLFYLPIAPLGVSVGWPLWVGVLAGGVLSLTAEATQLFSVDRAPDGNDLVANMAGTTGGAVIVLVYRRARGKHEVFTRR